MKALIKSISVAICIPAAAVLCIGGLLLGEDDATAAASTGLRNVPAEFEPWIHKADEACDHPELSPALLAAQLAQESGFSTDRNTAVSPAGAQGPAQFMPGTWATWGRDDDHKGGASPWDIGDAVMAQGRMMCSLIGQAKKSGYPGDPRALALAGYNAGWGAVQHFRGVPPIWFARQRGQEEGETYKYVRLILAALPRYQGAPQFAVSGSGAGPAALRRAGTRMGTPYSWGGGTPNGPSRGFCDGTNGYLHGSCSASVTAGFDCSSLVQYAYWPTTKLPRTAAAQYGATASHPIARANLQPGDLMFWSKSGSGAIYHVALYAGDGRVLHAPRTGRNVELVPLDTAMPARDYYGATRP